jgi:DNA-directed RNA polymerase subunit RPC12/RpoP
VAKGLSGNVTRHFGADPRGPGTRCVKCGDRILYGERCPPCQRELRQRKRRKPR